MSWRRWVPLALFAGFVALAAFMLTQPKDDTVASKMIGKPVPAFALPQAVPERPGLALADLKDGKPKLMNIWASWCVPCVAEAPELARLKGIGVDIVGVAIRDRPEEIESYLQQNGNPYSRIGADDTSVVQFNIGSSGVPETFVVDGKGVIRYQVVGEIRPEHIPVLLEKLREARQ